MTNEKTCVMCEEVGDKFVDTPFGMFCEACIHEMHEMITEDNNVVTAEPTITPEPQKTPSAIIAELDKYVVGQDSAKKTIALAIYNHFKRVNHGKMGDVEVQKSNLLLIGPSGTGKTMLAQTVAKFLDLPFAIADATTLTEAGYVGSDVQTILARLIQSADGDVSKAEHGILVLDEADKIARKSEGPSITRDVSGEGVQQALLKIIEGDKVEVMVQGNRMTPGARNTTIDTSNILFICAGAFVGLDKIVEKNHSKQSYGIGFSSKLKTEATETNTVPEPEDLYEFGLIPELVGRLPVVCTLEELDVSALKKILTEPKNAIIKQFQHLLSLEGTKLVVTDASVEKIANEAITRKTGARGLRSIVERELQGVMLSNPDNPKDVVTLDVVNDKFEVI